MSDLMQKLAMAKKIMEVHDKKPRGNSLETTYQEPVANIPETNVKYNIPTQQETKMPRQVNEDSIIKSKLPDEIKRLMIENPIDLPSIGGPVLSDDIIEGASRLMGTSPQRETIREVKEEPSNSDLKQMIRDVVRDTVRDVVKEELQRAGLLTESTQKTNESMTIKVGSHIFEGTVTKIKKVK
jgi:hypothetical protein